MACTEPGAPYPDPWPQEPSSPSAPMVGHTAFPTAPTRLRRSSMTSTALPSRTKPTTSFPSRLRFHRDGVARLLGRLDEHQVGDTVRLTVRRDGKDIEIRVTRHAGA